MQQPGPEWLFLATGAGCGAGLGQALGYCWGTWRLSRTVKHHYKGDLGTWEVKLMQQGSPVHHGSTHAENGGGEAGHFP